MTADEVLVTSHPFDTGRDHFRTLHFREGLGHRPLLLEEQPTGLSALVSTRVRLRLTPERYSSLLTIERFENSFSVTPSQLVGMLCPMLDVDVHVEDEGELIHVHSRRWMDEDRLSWLRRITAEDTWSDTEMSERLKVLAPRLRFIDDSDPSLGLACIADGYYGAATVGTLRAAGSAYSLGDGFAGAIDYDPSDPRRSRGHRRADIARVAAWASEQAKLIAHVETDQHDLITLSEKVAGFGGDATDIARLKLNGKWLKIEEIFDFIASNGPAFAQIDYGYDNSGPLYIESINQRPMGRLINFDKNEFEYVVDSIEVFSPNHTLYLVPDEENHSDSCAISLLSKFAARKGFRIETEILERVDFARYIGEDFPRYNLKKGMLIGGLGVKISAVQIST